MEAYATRLRAVAPARYHDVVPTLVRFLGPVCTSSESGGCVWFTRYGPAINNHKCRDCGGAFCDVHHTTDMCTECTGQNFCLVCLGRQPCYRTGCNRPAVDFVHGYHAYYAFCVTSRGAPDAQMDCTVTGICNSPDMFACAEHSFKRTYDKTKNLNVHAYNCTFARAINTPAPVTHSAPDSCVLQ